MHWLAYSFFYIVGIICGILLVLSDTIPFLSTISKDYDDIDLTISRHDKRIQEEKRKVENDNK